MSGEIRTTYVAYAGAVEQPARIYAHHKDLRVLLCEVPGGAEIAKEISNRLNAFPDMLATLKAYEQWEADLIMSDAAWAGGMASMPTFTQSLYDRFMEIQAMRNAALAKAKGQN